MWRIGFTIFILSNLLGSTVQIAALPLTVLAPLHACGLVYNAILATLLLGEPFTYLSMAGTLLVAVGATMIAVFGAINEPSHNLKQLLHLFAAGGFVGWMSFQVVLALSIVAAVSVASRAERGKTETSRTVQGAALGVLAGIMASHCLLLAKLTVELLVKTFGEGQNQFTRWQAWVIPIGLATGAITQLYYLNRGLRMCSTSILYPLNFSIYNITAILDGLIYYKQAKQLTKLQIGMVILGVILLLLGVAGLSWKLTVDKEEGGLSVSIPGVYDVPPENPWSSPKTPREVSQDEEHEVWGVLADDDQRSARTSAHRPKSAPAVDRTSGERPTERTGLLDRRRSSSPIPSRFQSFKGILGRYSFMKSNKPSSDANR